MTVGEADGGETGYDVLVAVLSAAVGPSPAPGPTTRGALPVEAVASIVETILLGAAGSVVGNLVFNGTSIPERIGRWRHARRRGTPAPETGRELFDELLAADTDTTVAAVCAATRTSLIRLGRSETEAEATAVEVEVHITRALAGTSTHPPDP